ncbi:hypothetical protein VNI00_018285 [Paramarasmius palmivorus]|uniref:Uncharacterized protein n=1 Tax=Paramarasmius palmivorus TaxID=297713 RepID=A0AAW0B0F9_9AGAR
MGRSRTKNTSTSSPSSSAKKAQKKATHQPAPVVTAVKRSHKARASIQPEEEAAEKKKRGRKSDWPEEELSFLKGWLPVYVETKGNKGSVWSRLFPAFLEKFPKYRGKVKLIRGPSGCSIVPFEGDADSSTDAGSGANAASSNDSADSASSSNAPDAANAAGTNTVEASTSTTVPADAQQAADKATFEAAQQSSSNEEAEPTPDSETTEVLMDWEAIKTVCDVACVQQKSLMERTLQKATNWFYNHKGDDARATGWQPLYRGLSAPPRRPVRVPTFKFYMRIPENSAKVKEQFRRKYLEGLSAEDIPACNEDNVKGSDEREEEVSAEDVDQVQRTIEDWDSLDDVEKRKMLKTHGVAMRCVVAREMFQAEPSELQESLSKKNEEVYQNKLAKIKASQSSKAVASADDSPELKELRRDNIIPAAESWAADISAMTGMHVSIFLGMPRTKTGEKIKIESIHSGLNSDGKRWVEHDREKVKKATKYFFSYLETCTAEPAPREMKEDKEKSKKGKGKGKGKKKERENDGRSQDSVSGVQQPDPDIVPQRQPSESTVQPGSSGSPAPPVAGSPSNVQTTTKEGGPTRNPANPHRPKKRPPLVKAPSQPKKMSARMRRRILQADDSDEEEDSEGTLEDVFEDGLEDDLGNDLGGSIEREAEEQGDLERSHGDGALAGPSFFSSLNPENPDQLFPEHEDGLTGSISINERDASYGMDVDPKPTNTSSSTLVTDQLINDLNNMVSNEYSLPVRAGTSDGDLELAEHAQVVSTPAHPQLVLEATKLIPRGEHGEWAEQALKTLTTSESLVQLPVWQHILHQFFTLQSIYSFSNPNSQSRRLPSDSRPLIYKKWFKEARLDATPNPFPPLEQFADGLWAWWESISPGWRERIGDRHISRSKSGDWSMLRYPGQNGLLLPIVGLQWWYLTEAKEGGSKDWKELAEDVLWTVESIVKWEIENPQALPPISTQKPSASQPPPSSQWRLARSIQHTSDSISSSQPPSSTQRRISHRRSGATASTPLPASQPPPNSQRRLSQKYPRVEDSNPDSRPKKKARRAKGV